MPARTEPLPIPRVAEHQARKEYPCDDPDNRGCRRHILKGDLYVQLSWPPHSRPFNSPTWTIARACSTCRPTTAPAPGGEPCPIGTAGQTCLRAIDHAGPHEYLESLF